MFDPVTLSTIGTSAIVLGSVVGAVGAISSSQAAANQAEYQADIAEEQAAQERIASRQEEEDTRREHARLFAKRRAALGGSGVQLAEGSPLLASEDFASESELQALRVRAGGEQRATRLEQQGELFKSSAKSSRTAGFIRGGSLLLSGAGQAWG